MGISRFYQFFKPITKTNLKGCSKKYIIIDSNLILNKLGKA